jgi:2'-5' RNA ligase
MRVFAGIFPPDEVFAELEAHLDPVLRLRPDLRWIRGPVWHLTLAFFGNVTLDEVSTLNNAVAQVVNDCPAPTLRISGAGTYPESVAVQELFLSVQCPDDDLLGLRRELLSSVRKYGWMVDRRSFRQHIPIARSDPGTDVSGVLQELSDYQGPSWRVPSVAVVWTRQGEDGDTLYDLMGEHFFEEDQPRE